MWMMVSAGRKCRGGPFNQAVRELVSYYVAMEEFCMEQNVGKAVEIREHSADSLTTSMVDDAFFILQKASFGPLSQNPRFRYASLVTLLTVTCDDRLDLEIVHADHHRPI